MNFFKVGEDESDGEHDERISEHSSDSDEYESFDEDATETLDTYALVNDNSTVKVHLRCFAHSLQLVVKNSLKKCKNVNRLLGKCFKIGNKFRQKKELANFLSEKKYNTIPKPLKVRWNSELKTLRAISKIRLADLTMGLSLTSDTNLVLTDNESKRLTDIINILDPFEYVTDLLQGCLFLKFKL